MAQARGWKIIKTRWIDISKRDDDNPVYRSRLVGKEFNNEAMDGIYAGDGGLSPRSQSAFYSHAILGLAGDL